MKEYERHKTVRETRGRDARGQFPATGYIDAIRYPVSSLISSRTRGVPRAFHARDAIGSRSD